MHQPQAAHGTKLAANRETLLLVHVHDPVVNGVHQTSMTGSTQPVAKRIEEPGPCLKMLARDALLADRKPCSKMYSLEHGP